MNIKITGKELKATEAIKNYIDSKAERLQKYFDTEDIDLFVTIKKEGDDQVAEMQISVNVIHNTDWIREKNPTWLSY